MEFGCILNNTETTQVVMVTNNSPLEVKYDWSFLKGFPKRRDPLHDDEGVDMQSEIETDSLDGSTSSYQQEEQTNGLPLLPPSNTDTPGDIPSSHDEERDHTPHLKGSVRLTTPSMELIQIAANDLPNTLSYSCAPSEPSESTIEEEEKEEERQVQPWETVSDPFQPMRIEQVRIQY